MTDKELKKLSRAELLEMLLEQSRTVELLQAQLDAARRKLESRDILIQQSGSIAEAALKLNDVFSAAQMAADQYLENVAQLQSRCDGMEQAAQAEAEQILADAQKQSEDMIRSAQEESQKWWDRTSQQLEAFYDAHQGLRELMEVKTRMYQKDQHNG